MKKIHLYTIIACTAAIVSSCHSTNDCTTPPSPIHILGARIEQPSADNCAQALFDAKGHNASSRTIIEPTPVPHPIVWRTGDYINIHIDTDPDGIMRLYRLSEGAGTTQGTFAYLDSSSSNPEIPYNKIPDLPESYNSLIAGYSGLLITFSATDQEIVLQTPVEIFHGLNAIEDFAMVGRAQSDGNIVFNCVFGIICLPITGNVSITGITIDTSASALEISGFFVLDPQTSSVAYQRPILNHNQYTVTWASQQAKGLQLSSTPTMFYAILPPGTYANGTQIKFQTGSGATIIKTAKQSFTVTRASILNLPTLNITQ